MHLLLVCPQTAKKLQKKESLKELQASKGLQDKMLAHVHVKSQADIEAEDPAAADAPMA